MNRGFSLIEVVIAVGVFAVGIVIVVALMGPIGSSMRAVADESSADRIVNLVNWGLRTVNYDDLISGTWYSPKDGGQFNAAPSTSSFFQIDIELSDSSPGTREYLMFDVCVTWPMRNENGSAVLKVERKSLTFVTVVNR